MNKQIIEHWEYHYFNVIKFLLEQDTDKMLSGLASKEEIRKDWENEFNASSKNNSDFARGAERIYYWLFNQLGKPNSSPIGADMMFETYNAYLHIDIKTAKFSNKSDFFNKVNVGQNQTSYENKSFNANLPYFYQKNETKKYCLTYIILVIYDDKNLEILAIILTCIPNGKLFSIYKNDIMDAGKNKGSSFRFKYHCNFKLIDNQNLRYYFIYLNENYKKTDFVK